jgi:hypothetical protein
MTKEAVRKTAILANRTNRKRSSRMKRIPAAKKAKVPRAHHHFCDFRLSDKIKVNPQINPSAMNWTSNTNPSSSIPATKAPTIKYKGVKPSR